MAKHVSIYPAQEELDIIMELVNYAEDGLKSVSDICMHEFHAGQRELVGVARVGELAKVRPSSLETF